MSQESCQDRQNNELEVLRSIFGDELRVVNQSKNNKKWQPLNIYITLTPQKGMSGPAEVYAQVDLHVICGDKYPTKVPRIQLENSKGLSDQKISSHLLELEKLARELEGEEMIYELCQHTQKFLHEHNKPTFSSFYDEMVTKQQEKIQNELLEKQLREDQERQVLQDEILKRKEALKAEIRNRRDSLMDNNVATQSLPSPPIERIRNLSRRRNTSTSESSESLCEHRGTKTLNFDNKQTERKVYRGKCLGHSTKGSIVHAGVDNTTGELLAVTEWTLKCGSSGNYDNGEATNLQNIMKQIASIEQELNHLNKLRHHNLVHYLNMKYFQDKDKIKIYILQEFVVGTTCSFYLSDNIPVDTVMLRHLATGVLTALSYLHENNVVHKDLRDSSVHIDRSGMVKVADYSLEKRLSDIHGSSCLAKAEHDFPTTQGRGGKKADIYRFGILMLSLLKGEIVSNKDLSKEVDLSIKPDLRDFLNKCLVNNERTRWTAEQLLEHCFIKTAPDRGFHPSKLHPNLEGKNLVEPERDQPEAEVNFHLPSLGGSRIQNEFEVLKWLGKGAFGDVLKVKNKLDGCIYAIKRIKLNPKNKQLNKKITREVKLLSRLNHENVVRYYNSWIESANLNDSPRSSRLTPSESLPSSVPLTGTDDKTTSSTDDYLESVADVNLAPPPMHEVGWNISYESRTSAARSRNSQEDDGDQSSDDSDTDEEWPFVNPRTHIDSSDSIQFERDDKSPTSESAQNFPELVVEKNGNENEKEEASIREIQFMYIQMEFCEKSTLRTAIDNGLYEDEDRIWRLFREIIEGLAHIHQQAMIHRDLKPVNIFLDSNDHVKIGDFGLATTNILSNLTHPLEFEKETQIIHEKGISSEIDYGGSLTGQVGTALYVAPELSTKVEKAIYNQKVDIYSLGIIFFEMCHKPLSTGMERVKVLLNLRSKDIILPPELDETFDSGKTRLLRWLLNHDPSQRPTSQELLASELLPPPELEETELQDMARRTLSNIQSKAYKYLIGCCLSQDNTTTAADLTYEMNLMGRNILTSKSRFFREFVKSKIVEVFQRHGGISITTPLLMPKSGSLYSSIDSHVRLMTRTGSVVSIPHDLHASFARYVALNSISNVRRYAIERVYRETKVHGFHPRELYECAFDIISPTVNNLMPEAELLYMTSEIFNQIPKLQDRGFVVRINHTSLLQAVLMYSGIESEKYQDIYSIIRDAREENLSKLQVRTRLISLCLTDQAMDILFNLFDTESTVQKISGILKTITKRKGDAAGFAKKGLTEIEIVIEQAQALGVKWPITIVPLLVNNTQLYSGIIYQVTCEIKRRRRHGAQDVIAAGGRYDSLLRSFRQMFERTGMNAEQKKQCGVGISISLDKVVSVANELSEEFFHDNRFTVDVAVCNVDGASSSTELADILRELWSLGLKVICLDLKDSVEIFEYCNLNMINHVLMIKKANLRVHTKEKAIFLERKITIQELGEYFQKYTENASISVSLNRSDSKISNNLQESFNLSNSNNPVDCNINFVTQDKEKISGSQKKSFKNMMSTHMTSHLQRFSHKVSVEVFAVNLESPILRMIANFLEIDVADEQEFERSILPIVEKYSRHKKYIKQICDKMREVRSDKSRPVLILHSLNDMKFVTIM